MKLTIFNFVYFGVLFDIRFHKSVCADENVIPIEGIDSPLVVNLFRNVKHYGMLLFGKTSENNRYYRKAKEQNKLQDVVPLSDPFPCPLNGTRSSQRPKSVNELRPGDIDVIGALGDSLTAGNGIVATNFISVVFGENRGLTFDIGGQNDWRQTLTLPNILKMFNSNLIGYSLGDSLTTHKESQFNVAEGGAVSLNTPYMAKLLVQRITNDPRVNLTEDWKMITYLIGGNDFCSDMCYYANPMEIVEKHKRDLISALTILRDNLPRTFVNVIPGPHLRLLRSYNNIPEKCYVPHAISCPCIMGARFQKYQNLYDEVMTKWQKTEFEIVNDSQFHKDDFTVVYQPFIIGYQNPGNQGPTGITDYSFTSDDCFHFSQKGNAQWANLFWNNIMEPVGQKSVESTLLFKKFNCPTADHPFIFTNNNSNSFYGNIYKTNYKIFNINELN